MGQLSRQWLIMDGTCASEVSWTQAHKRVSSAVMMDKKNSFTNAALYFWKQTALSLSLWWAFFLWQVMPLFVSLRKLLFWPWHCHRQHALLIYPVYKKVKYCIEAWHYTKSTLEVSSSVQNWVQEVGGLARKATIPQHAVHLSPFFLRKEKGVKKKPGSRHKHITHATSDN